MADGNGNGEYRKRFWSIVIALGGFVLFAIFQISNKMSYNSGYDAGYDKARDRFEVTR